MAKLDLLKGNLEVAENPGIETLDPRFQEIAGSAQNANYPELISQIEPILQDKIYDIRLIGYYCFACFHSEGFSHLLEVFQTLNSIFEENWEAIGPTKKKDRQTENALYWFLGKMEKVLKMHEDKDDEKYHKWLEEASSEFMDSLMEEVDKLSKNVQKNLEKAPKTLDGLSNLSRWLQGFHKLVFDREEEERLAEEEAQKKADEEAQRQADQEAASAARAEALANMGAGGAVMMGAGGGGGVEGSFRLDELKQKLKAFEILIEKGEMPKAALVADDIGAIIADFDPTLYLPQLFAAYFALLSTNIEDIAGFWEKKGSLPWQVMDKLYSVDLQAFIEI